MEYKQGYKSPLKENVGSLTPFRSHFSKFLSTVGSIFIIFVLLRYNFLRLPSIMIGRHFNANMKVQTVVCEDTNNSKCRAATNVKFDVYIK